MTVDKARIGRTFRAAAVALALSGVVAGPFVSLPVQAEEQTLNYRDADIRAFIDDVAMMTGTTFIVDPRVKGQVTVISRTSVDSKDVFDVFLATLRVNGYSVSPMSNGAYKVLPNDAAVESATLGGEIGAGDRFVTEVFKLNHVDGGTAQNMLKPLVNSEGRVVANRGSDFVVVVDYASNMNRIRQVMADIDQDLSVFTSVPLQNTSASEMAQIVTSLTKAGSDDGPKAALSAVAIEGTNTLVLRGERQSVARMAAFAEDLDARNVNRKARCRGYSAKICRSRGSNAAPPAGERVDRESGGRRGQDIR